MKHYLLRYTFLSIISLVLFSCGGEDNSISKPSDFSKYIQAYTSGALSKNDKIRVDLAQNVDLSNVDWSVVKSEVFTFEPGLEGSPILQDNNTLLFEPKSRMPSGVKYSVQLHLDKLFAVPDTLKRFSFEFNVIPQSFDVYFNGIEANPDNPAQINLKGAIEFADVVSLAEAKKIIKANVSDNQVDINWDDAESQKRYFKFRIEGIERKEVVQNVVIKWNGDPLGIEKSGNKTVEVPALGDFSLLTSHVVTSDGYYLSLNFSDPVDANQTLDGLIEIEGENVKLRFEVEANEVKVYVPDNFDANKTVLIHEGVKNVESGI